MVRSGTGLGFAISVGPRLCVGRDDGGELSGTGVATCGAPPELITVGTLDSNRGPSVEGT